MPDKPEHKNLTTSDLQASSSHFFRISLLAMGIPSTRRAVVIIAAQEAKVIDGRPLPAVRDHYVLVEVVSVALDPADYRELLTPFRVFSMLQRHSLMREQRTVVLGSRFVTCSLRDSHRAANPKKTVRPNVNLI